MKNKTLSKIMKISVVLLIVASVAAGILVAPKAQEEEFKASYIEKLNNVKVDYSDYLDSSVMQQLPDTIRDDQEISVIILTDQATVMDAYNASAKTMSFTEFAADADEAQLVRGKILDKKEQVLKTLNDKGVNYSVGADYDTLLSGFELVIKAGEFETIAKSLDKGFGIYVSEEYNVAETQLVENEVNVYETGIFKSGESGYDGSGMVVAVLDTGLDSKHTAFSTDNFTSKKLGMTYEDVAAVVGKTKANELAGGLGVDDVYVNEKVPFGYDYADNDPDVYSTHNNHGTHVSGVIVGKDDTITGVAPNAQLVSMKVFSDIMDTARASWILNALEDCVILGVDVINMSLGTACGFSREGDEELESGVYQKIRDAGISLIVAASNSYNSAYSSEKNGNLPLTSNPDSGTVGSPGTYEGAMSVASISGKETPYILFDDTIIYFEESTNGTTKENDFVLTLLGDEQEKEFEYVLIPGVGRTADYTGLDMSGKIALVRRGDNTFEEKAMIAEAQGAAGIIVYNNVSGEIKMNVGKAKLAVCSISQDDGELMADKGSGKLIISKSQTSGPFISDFSSWGPGPNLEIKPEITAHGGNILSSVTGGGYDRLSGTSMACPNLAGVAILLRQYVVENFPEIANDNVKVNRMVNALMMSTADIALNTNGLPYSVRKQGAGLANLMNSIETPAYITTYDKEGKAMDKPKLQLGDDKGKKGVYEMTLSVTNFGNAELQYRLGAYVLTEGVSETKTAHGLTTVTGEAYALEGIFEIINNEGGSVKKDKLTIAAGESAKITVRVTLTEEDKKYLNDSFENGMYVEGYVTLEALEGTDIDLNAPYLAFYGDWTVAPLFDLTYFQTNADELNDGKAMEDKVMPDAYASRPIGGVSEDYVSYLGSYYFLQDPNDVVIAANEDFVALSNQEGTIHSLRFVWGGLLRNAQRIEIQITDDVTGEVIFETVDTDVRKSYGDGGPIYPANIEIEFDTMDYNLKNNTEYTVTLTGYLDYEDGGINTNKSNSFSFPLTIDFEAPTVTDVEFTYEYDRSLKKNRLYANVSVYDNHFSMAAQLGYVGMSTDADGNAVPEMFAFEQYMTPIYSKEDSYTTVRLELTDYIYELKEGALNDLTFAVTCYDYALNYATYEIGLPANYIDFYFEDLEDGGITLSPNEVYTLDPLIHPSTEWGELLNYASSRPGVARVVNNKIVAVASGTATIRASDPTTGKNYTFEVNVLKKGEDGYRRYDKPVADIFRLTGYHTQKAFYVLDSSDKKIGDTGDKRFFEGNYHLSMYPSEAVMLVYDLDAYFPEDVAVEFTSSNEKIVKVDAYGNVTAVAEGFASITVKVLQDGKSTYFSESVSVEVKDPFITTGASLTHYYGNGGLVTFPEDLTLTEIGNFAFSNFEYVQKTEEELAFDDAETSKQWFIGESTITKVVIPEGITKIGAYAFANLTGLEEIVLPSTLEAIEYGAFYGCVSLKKITFSSTNNLKIVNQHAFEMCNLQGTVDLSAVCVISDYAFAGNKELEGVTTSDTLLSIGSYAFAACEKLTTVTITAPKVKYGTYTFNGCEALTEYYVNAAVLPEGMFHQCKNLKSVSIGPDVKDIGEFAFRDTAVETLEIREGNKTYKVQSANYILSADEKTLVAVAPTVSGRFTASSCGGAEVTAIATGAFSHNRKINAVELPTVTVLGDYAFGSADSIVGVRLGELTEIGEYAFFETGITELPAFTASTKIGKYAFAFTKIKEVSIPEGMTVAEGVFSECKELAAVTVGDNVVLGKYAFGHNKDYIFKVESYNETWTVGEGENAVEKEEKYFYYTFKTALTSLTIGKNVVLGENAFANAHSLETVTLGENATIGKMAFYNNSSLKHIDLSKAVSIGDYAFSGDSYMICLDDTMQVGAVSREGVYMYTYHAPKLTSVDLSAAASIGEYAFVYCHELTTVKLGDKITELPQYAFADCKKLTTINLDKITKVGDYAFSECRGLEKISLPAATTIGNAAFVYNEALTEVTLNAEGCVIDDNAFAECKKLTKVENLNMVTSIGDYGFLNSALTEADLTAAEHIGTYAFMKPEAAPFKVTLGEDLETMGDNPFALCDLEPFCLVETTDFNGTVLEERIYDYEISDNVQVIGGSLYCKIATGLELITYAGTEPQNAIVADDTVRITGMAFAHSDIQRVTMPDTVFAIGHKAFYGCEDLKIVIFGSYEAPILEEEFDRTRYESFENMPGTGDFGEYTDYEGNQVQITGTGLIPYYMWNSTDGMYSNVFYGANFVDYVGSVDDKMLIVRPVNGTRYDTFVLRQYFDVDLEIMGAAARDKITLEAVTAIRAIPKNLTYENRDIVAHAREMYDKIASDEQRVLIKDYYEILLNAERTIASLAPKEEEKEEEKTISGWLLAGLILLGLLAATAVGAWICALRSGTKGEKRGFRVVMGETGKNLKKALLWACGLPVRLVVMIAAGAVALVAGILALVKRPFGKKAKLLDKPVDEEELSRKKERRAVVFKVALACVAVLLVVGLVLSIVLGEKDPESVKQENPYEANNAEKFNVSVRYDANGGNFTTNTAVIMDSYDLNRSPKDGNNAKIALLSPDNEVRGINAFHASKAGHFLAGWYRERIQTGVDAEGNPIYTYSGKWDFENDQLTVDMKGQYDAAEPVLTLYAAWVPVFQVELYDKTTGELVQTMNYDPTTGEELAIPVWNEETGAMDMNSFPKRKGYTFEEAYYDAAGAKPVGTTVDHPGYVDYGSATAVDPVLKLYVDWTEGEWYRIYTAAQLVENASIKGSYEICADLDFSNEIWPTELTYGSYTGTFNGNGHTIRNISITQKNNGKQNAGLFGQLTEKSVVKDIVFENVTFTIQKGSRVTGTSYGLFTGVLAEGAAISNVEIRSGKILIDSDCYFSSDDYVIGLLCGTGSCDLDPSVITCEATGKNPGAVKITVNGSDIQVAIDTAAAEKDPAQTTDPTETTEPTEGTVPQGTEPSEGTEPSQGTEPTETTESI